MAHALQFNANRERMSRSREFAIWAAPLSQEHQGPLSRVAAGLQRFNGKLSPLASGAPWWDTSGTLAQLTP